MQRAFRRISKKTAADLCRTSLLVKMMHAGSVTEAQSIEINRQVVTFNIALCNYEFSNIDKEGESFADFL